MSRPRPRRDRGSGRRAPPHPPLGRLPTAGRRARSRAGGDVGASVGQDMTKGAYPCRCTVSQVAAAAERSNPRGRPRTDRVPLAGPPRDHGPNCGRWFPPRRRRPIGCRRRSMHPTAARKSRSARRCTDLVQLRLPSSPFGWKTQQIDLSVRFQRSTFGEVASFSRADRCNRRTAAAYVISANPYRRTAGLQYRGKESCPSSPDLPHSSVSSRKRVVPDRPRRV